MSYSGGGYEYLKHYQSNSGFSSKLTVIILSVVAIAILYIVIRVVISIRIDKRRSQQLREWKRGYINRILERKNGSDEEE